MIGSQCEALPALSFLPSGAGPVEIAALSTRERLLVELRDLLVDGPGECDPVPGVDGVSAPGLLVNPTAAGARAAMETAMNAADAAGAVLVVHLVAHGSWHQDDPAAPVRHILHAWDTVAAPVDTEPESRGWDPYADIERRRPHCERMGGLVLLVDACWASWAKMGVDAWSGVRGGLVSAVLAASGDHVAWDGCLTRKVIDILRSGLTVSEHPRRVLVPELMAADIEPIVARRCVNQTPLLGGYQTHNPVLYVGRNAAAEHVAGRLGLDGATAGLMLRLTRHYFNQALTPVIDALSANRAVAVIGAAGTGKSTLAAALRNPPDTSTLPPGLVYAAAFVSTAPGVIELAHSLRGQLDQLAAFQQAAARFQRENLYRWDSLDVWQRDLIGPLSLFGQQVRVLIDGIDQLGGTLHEAPLKRALSALLDGAPNAGLVVLSRSDPCLDGAAVVEMPELSDTAARAYLTSRGVNATRGDQFIAMAAGRWLVLDLAASLTATNGATSLEGLYDELVDRARSRVGSHADAVLGLLAAVGTGSVLPIDVLEGALNLLLDDPVDRASLYRVLGDDDLYRVIDRTYPGTRDDRVGLFHQTLADHLARRADMGRMHEAIAEAIGYLAPSDRHDPKNFRDNPVLAYAFDALPRHRWEAGQPEMVLESLAYRSDVSPIVNLSRWAGWSARLEERLGADHAELSSARNNVAYWTGRTGDVRGALALFEALVSHEERTLGPEHPNTIRERHNVAALTGKTGNVRDALTQFEALVSDQERILGPEHHQTLATRINIASLTGQAGDSKRALMLFQALLPDEVRALGPDHSDTLTTRGNVAYWTGQGGDIPTALAMFEALLVDRAHVLGPEHPDTLTNRNNVAQLTGQVGDSQSALTLFELLLPDILEVLGPDHPDTLRTRNNIAYWTGQIGDSNRALALFEALLPDRLRVMGPDHPDTLTTRNNVAQLTGQTGNPQGALVLFVALLPDRARVLGAHHPDTLRTRNNVAQLTGQTGNPEGALTLFEVLTPDQVRVLGPLHPDTLTTRYNVAYWTLATGDPVAAMTLFKTLLPDQHQVLGPNHPSTLATRNYLAASAGLTGDAQGAAALFEALLPDEVRVLGADHPSTLVTRNNVAIWTGRAGDAREAVAMFEQLLPDQVRILGTDHRYTLTTRGNLAAWTGHAGDRQSALTMFESLLFDETRVLGPDHPDTLVTRENIAYWTSQLGDKRRALALREALLADRTRLLGDDHPDTLAIQMSIAEWRDWR